jgi:Flp pilus assembly pilin Flp
MLNSFNKILISQTVIVITGSLSYLVGKAWNNELSKIFKKMIDGDNGIKYTLFITIIAILLIAFLKKLEDNIHLDNNEREEELK